MKKVLLITGGSDGIGACTAKLAADQGFTVCINYLQNKTAAERIVNEIGKKGGEAVSGDRAHMAQIGKKGGEARGDHRGGSQEQRPANDQLKKTGS